MRLLVCGDRNWSDQDFINEVLDRIPDVEAVIEGEARGADTMARIWAESRGIPVMKYPANWKAFGKAAGPFRNKEMLARGDPDAIIAFHDDIENSRGTKHMVAIARAAGVKVILMHHITPDEQMALDEGVFT